MNDRFRAAVALVACAIPMAAGSAAAQGADATVLSVRIADAERAFGPDDLDDVIVEVTLAGAAVFAVFDDAGSDWLSGTSATHIGAPMNISVCGAVVHSETVPGALSLGSLRLVSRANEAEANTLAGLLRGGAPCPKAAQ